MTPTNSPKNDLDNILDATKDLWQELGGRRIFMTGGTGFFGAWLLQSFAAANEAYSLGASVTVLSRDPEKFIRSSPSLPKTPPLHSTMGMLRTLTFRTANSATSYMGLPEWPRLPRKTRWKRSKRLRKAPGMYWTSLPTARPKKSCSPARCRLRQTAGRSNPHSRRLRRRPRSA